MVSPDAINPFIIVHGVSRCEFHHYSELGLSIHFPDLLAEAKDVLLVRVELERGRISAIVLDVEDLFLGVLDFDRAKVETVMGKDKVISLSDTLAFKLQRVTSDASHIVMGA